MTRETCPPDLRADSRRARAIAGLVALVTVTLFVCATQVSAQKRAPAHRTEAPHAAKAAPAKEPATKAVTIATLGTIDPWRYAQANGALAKATGYTVTVRRFADSGAAVRALAEGGIDVAELGSAGIATAVSEGMDYQLFWILEDIASAEALVARNGTGITSIAALKGHRVATPFVSTSHYQLLYALAQAGIDPSQLTLVNLHPDEIAKAWAKGTIDAAFVWDPVLAILMRSGNVLVTSGQLCREGACTFDGLVVERGFAKAHPAFMAAFVRTIAAADADYRAHPSAWGDGSERALAVARETQADAAGVPASLARYRYPDLVQQASAEWLGGGAAGGAVKAITQQARFLHDQGRLQANLPDYAPFVTAEWVERALRESGRTP